MSLEKWIEQAKKDGVIKPKNLSTKDVEGKMEVNSGSIPDKKEYKKFTDDNGFNWITTPRGLKFPMPTFRHEGSNYSSLNGKSTYQRFSEMYPSVQQWLKSFDSKGTAGNYGGCLLRFCIDNDITPKEFGDLWLTREGIMKAKQIVTKYIQNALSNEPNKTIRVTTTIKSFFRRYSGGFKLPLDTGKGGALEVRKSTKEKHEKRRFSYGTYDEMRQKLAHMIPTMSSDLKDETALTFLYRTGVRNGVLNRIRVKHVQDRFRVDGTEVLCLTVTGEICLKTQAYPFQKLPDSDGQPRGYYTYLANDGLEIFDRFMAQYHANSPPKKLLFAKYEGYNFVGPLRYRTKRRLKKAGYPDAEIWLHQLRSCFDMLAHEVLKQNRAEMLAGHLLSGSQEHYQKRNKIDCAKDYLKILFKPSVNALKEKWLKELAEEKKAEEEKLKETIEIEEPTTILPTTPQELELKKEGFVLGPIPKHCLRNVAFDEKYVKDNSYCQVCMKTHPIEYQACQELRKEQPKLFI